MSVYLFRSVFKELKFELKIKMQKHSESTSHEMEVGSLLPIVRPPYNQRQSPTAENLPNQQDGLLVRCCRRKYTCIFTAMILLIVFLSFINDVMKRMDEESFFNINNFVNLITSVTNKTETLRRP